MQPEVPFLTTTVEKLKWFGQELTKLWKEKSNEKERIFIYLAIDPKGQCDLQGHMIFYLTYKLYGLSRFLWPICGSIQRIYRISNEFSFHTMYYETSCVFYIPEPLARGYKTHNEFHNTSYGMKIHLRFFLSHELTRNEQITRWNRLFPRIGDGWRRGLLRFDNKFALCSVINTRRRSHFTKVEIKKHQEEHVLM